jgi:hypothetical protein
MNKIVIHRRKHEFNLDYQNQTIQGLENNVYIVHHVVHTIIIQTMFLYQLNGDPKFQTLQIINPTCSKTKLPRDASTIK